MKAKAKEITPQELAGIIRRHPRVVALTGAGISVASGIPSFRGAGGLWDRYDPMEYAHIQAFRRHPAKVWNLLKEMDAVISRARPGIPIGCAGEFYHSGAGGGHPPLGPGSTSFPDWTWTWTWTST